MHPIHYFMQPYTNNSELFAAIKEGDTGAFEYLFKTYHPRLRNYASRFVQDEGELDDIIQDCFVRLWEQRTALTDISLSSLLFTMVRNRCLNYLRHKTCTTICKIDALLNQQGSEQLYAMDMHHQPDEETICAELTREIAQILDSLPPRCREVFVLSRFEGLKNREIAEQLGISVKVVEKQMTKALTTFRKMLAAEPKQSTRRLLLLLLPLI